MHTFVASRCLSSRAKKCRHFLNVTKSIDKENATQIETQDNRPIKIKLYQNSSSLLDRQSPRCRPRPIVCPEPLC